jgi:hypothetical protein
LDAGAARSKPRRTEAPGAKGVHDASGIAYIAQVKATQSHSTELTMLKILFGTALFLTGLSAAAQAQSKQDFQLVNKTGYDISEIYISAAKADDWGDDLLEDSDDTLEDGKSVPINFTNAKTCIWDIKVVYDADDSEAIWHDIDLCKIRKITLRYKKSTDETTAIFE